MNPSAPADPAAANGAHDFQLPLPGQASATQGQDASAAQSAASSAATAAALPSESVDQMMGIPPLGQAPEQHGPSFGDAGAAAGIPGALPRQDLPAMDPLPQVMQQGAPQQPASSPAPSDNSSILMSPPGTPPPPPQGGVTSPQVAEDVDLIEKEWVVKAKEIVTRTRSDPHVQNKEMNRFKADYLKKRYNKDIKTNE